MYIKVVKRAEGRRKEKGSYIVRYFDSESGEGLNEQFRRYYGLGPLRPGSFFTLSPPDSLDEWAGFQRQRFSN